MDENKLNELNELVDILKYQTSGERINNFDYRYYEDEYGDIFVRATTILPFLELLLNNYKKG